MLLVNLAAHSTAVEIIVGLVMLAVVLRVGNVIRYIPNDQVGIVEKLWSARGSVEAGFIALAREAGFQPDILRGGIHFFFPFTYRVHRKPLVTIAQGKLGYVFARGGAPLRTDAGNLIYDLACGPIADPRALDAALHATPGVVETGLFLGRADVVLIAGTSGVERRAR